jgi:sugar transferase EpsL
MVKRFIDIVGSVLIALFVSLFFLVIPILIRRKLGSPILFRQMRPGLRGAPFQMLKFRTMKDLYDEDGCLLADEQRMTSLGNFLRNSSLDELPELWNVLRGDMSLVGPRPLLMEYLPLYTGEQARRHEVKPGITGWAQVNGRNTISWEDKFRLDVWYVDHQSFLLDLKILFLTIRKVIRCDGVSQSGHVTVERFRGRIQ